MTQPDLLAELSRLPQHWHLVAVDGEKRPYQRQWERRPLDQPAMAREIASGKARGIGVMLGPASGLMALDLDGPSAADELTRLGVPIIGLPPTWAVTSGRPGRQQLLFTVAADRQDGIRPTKRYPVGPDGQRVIGDDGKAENLDLRWHGQQSIVAGAHPITGAYRWVSGCSPADLPLAEAPDELLELMRRPADPEPQPDLPPPPISGTVPLIDFITRDSRDLIQSGGTPGAWNDDHLRLALDLQGTEAWLLAQGVRPDATAEDLFRDHCSAAARLSPDFDRRKAMRRFSGAAKRSPGPGTPEAKLMERLRYHTRIERSDPVRSRASDTATPEPMRFDKPQKLEAGELLAMLRAQAGGGRIRFNTFTQQLEIDGVALEGSERFYLSLAEQGYKVSKELALDCLVQVGRENPYDPVRLYLDHVAATVAPAYINGLATAYLRPEDTGPTLYDHMIRCTLIGAVRRVYEPGSKHDTATVLMGEQGARKSSFWSALGGPFFSDALGDISSKDDLMVLHRSWIMEWAELDHITGRKHAGQVKAFLSQSTDFFRVPYGKATEAFPRRGIIVGSTNRSTGFLQDDTGNRRFWVVPTTRTEPNPIDIPALMAERDAIWSAAVLAYRAGAVSYLPSDLAQQVTSENESYQVDNPWLPAVAHWIEQRLPGENITTERILCEAIQKPIERQTRADQMTVADILRVLGYERRRSMVDGQRQWRWHSAI